MPARSILSNCSIVYSLSRSKQKTASSSSLFSPKPPISKIFVVEIFMETKRRTGYGITRSIFVIFFMLRSNFSMLAKVPLSRL